jgi:hypothetical protein
MKSLNKIIGVFLLTLFVAYSGGVGFSVHNCQHCRQKKIYLFQHPDCCSAATEEHHHEEDDCGKSSDICCHHHQKDASKEGKNTDSPHCKPCCFSEFQFYKITGSYFAPKYEKLAEVAAICLFINELSFHLEQQNISEKIYFSENNPNPPPLLPGGERFFAFSHQLLFYA